MKPFVIANEVNGTTTHSIPFSDYVNVQTLDSGVAETVNIPAQARFIIFTATNDFFARINGTASIPVTDVTDGSGSELNPIIRSLADVTSISLISSFACTVTMSFYS